MTEAATAPSPTQSPEAGGVAQREAPRRKPVAPPRPTVTQARQASRSVLAPLATYSSALWLRVTGLFFGMVATVMGSGAWRTRGALHPGAVNPSALRHFWVFAAFAGLFGYFAVSGFVRANVRERRAKASR